MAELIIEKLELNDIIIYESGLRVKVLTQPMILDVKIREKDLTLERYKAVFCMMAMIDKPLMKDKNGDPIPGIKTFEFYQGSFRITEDGKVNLGKDVKKFIPAATTAAIIDNNQLPN